MNRLYICCFVAIAVVLLAEAGTRYALNRGLLRDHSLIGAVEQNLAELRAEEPQMWLVGNSTLYYGVDSQVLAKRVGIKLISLVHGSATLAGSVDMAKYYLREIEGENDSRPVLVFCITRDDLNRNGYRAKVSNVYRGGIKPKQSILGWARLARCRQSLLLLLKNGYIWLRGGGQPPARSVEFSGLRLNADWLQGLSENFEFDLEALEPLAVLRRAGYTVALVNMPVTAMYRDFFDNQSYGITVEDIGSRLQSFCEMYDVKWIDLGDAIPEESLFRDPYHVSEVRGRGVLTELLGERLGE